MTPNMRALEMMRSQEEMLPPEIGGGMTRKVETVMPLEQYQQMQMASPSELPQEMMDPELMRRMGM
jgi:proteasome lid subunit RPN8/RPN11